MVTRPPEATADALTVARGYSVSDIQSALFITPNGKLYGAPSTDLEHPEFARLLLTPDVPARNRYDRDALHTALEAGWVRTSHGEQQLFFQAYRPLTEAQIGVLARLARGRLIVFDLGVRRDHEAQWSGTALTWVAMRAILAKYELLAGAAAMHVSRRRHDARDGLGVHFELPW